MPVEKAFTTDYVIIPHETIATTEKHILIKGIDGVESWMPRDKCKNGGSINVGDDKIEVLRWFASAHGLV